MATDPHPNEHSRPELLRTEQVQEFGRLLREIADDNPYSAGGNVGYHGCSDGCFACIAAWIKGEPDDDV